MQFCPDDGTALVVANRDPLVGRVIGERYRLDERLGRGAMGTVYRALHTRMDKPVAVKLLRAELAGDPEAVARFHREARSASRLDHEHCIRVTDFGQSDDGLLYLVMELLDGEALSARVARGPLPAELVAAIGEDVASALAHAHEHGVIHRDLKPDNVMLARRGRRSAARTVVKVLDFGLAKIAGETGTASLTRAGSVFGTPEYMAPEQAEGLVLDPRTDLYSLGVVLYQLATGQLPFRAPNVIQLLAQQVEELPEPPRALRPDLNIPVALEAVILRCLAKRREDRFADAAALAAALHPLADHRLLEHPPEGIRSDDTPPPRDPNAERAAARNGADAHAPERAPAATAATQEKSAPLALDSEGASDAPSRPSISDSTSDLNPPAARGRRGIVLASVVLVSIAMALVVVARRLPATTRSSSSLVAPATSGEPLTEARKRLDSGDLDGAATALAAARAARDGAPVQLLLGELAQRRGNRLAALAHLHRATRLAPTAAEPHARLATLLQQLGQPEAACREATAALRSDPANSLALAAAGPCKSAAP